MFPDCLEHWNAEWTSALLETFPGLERPPAKAASKTLFSLDELHKVKNIWGFKTSKFKGQKFAKKD